MMDFEKITEEESNYSNLEKMSVHDLLLNINKEDQTVPLAVEKAIPSIEALIDVVVEKMQDHLVEFFAFQIFPHASGPVATRQEDRVVLIGLNVCPAGRMLKFL